MILSLAPSIHVFIHRLLVHARTERVRRPPRLALRAEEQGVLLKPRLSSYLMSQTSEYRENRLYRSVNPYSRHSHMK